MISEHLLKSISFKLSCYGTMDSLNVSFSDHATFKVVLSLLRQLTEQVIHCSTNP